MFIFLWILCGVIGAIIGDRKGRAGSGFLLGILFGPIGILVVFAMKGDRTTCPFCKELIHKDAMRCAHCQKELISITNEIGQSKTKDAKNKTLKSKNVDNYIVFGILITILIVLIFLFI